MYAGIQRNAAVYQQCSLLLRQQLRLKDLVRNEPGNAANKSREEAVNLISLAVQQIENESLVNPCTLAGFKLSYSLVGSFLTLIASAALSGLESLSRGDT